MQEAKTEFGEEEIAKAMEAQILSEENLATPEPTHDIDTKTLYQPQRLENESFEEYKERRLVAKYKNHLNAKGRLIWDSKNQGTYQVKEAA